MLDFTPVYILHLLYFTDINGKDFLNANFNWADLHTFYTCLPTFYILHWSMEILSNIKTN